MSRDVSTGNARWRAGWRVALRIARRDAWRARGRSTLIIAMIGLPIMAVAAVDVIQNSFNLNPQERLTRDIGTADASLRVVEGGAVSQAPDGTNWTTSAPSASASASAKLVIPSKLLAALPPGSRIITDTIGSAQARTPHGITIIDVRELNYADPLAIGMLRQLTGRVPQADTEVALTDVASQRLGARLGAVIHLVDRTEALTVVGIVESPNHLGDSFIVGRPGALLSAGEGNPETTALADTPSSVSWPAVLALNTRGVLVVSRSVMLDPPPDSAVPYFTTSGSSYTGTAETFISVVGIILVMLEIGLLAGTAFAVGARRQRRTLGLLAVAGGQRAQLRRVVLATGVVLGLVGGVAGVVLGVSLAAVGLEPLAGVFGARPGSLDIRFTEILIAAVGLITGLGAAYLPARAASRLDPVAAVNGRETTPHSRLRRPLIGGAIAIIGAIVTLDGGRRQNSTATPIGVVMVQLGLILCTPALITMIGLLARKLPLTPRLAMRDATRHRSRTTPAVAAIMAAVAGSVTISMYSAALDVRDKANYNPTEGAGITSLNLANGMYSPINGDSGGLAPRLLRAVAPVVGAQSSAIIYRTIPSSGPASCRTANDQPNCPDADLALPPQQKCPFTVPDGVVSDADQERLNADPRCSSPLGYGIGIADEATLRLALGITDPRLALAQLARGGAITFDRRYITDGHVTAQTLRYDATQDTTVTLASRRLPATFFPASSSTANSDLAAAYVSADTAQSLGLIRSLDRVLFDTGTAITGPTEEKARAVLQRITPDAYLYVERGYVSSNNGFVLAIVIAAGIITLLGAAIATGLAAADGRADQATLAAVGASPGVRRTLSAAQAAVISLLGAGLGVLAGAVPGAALAISAMGDRLTWGPLVPWRVMGMVLIVVPLLISALAWLTTRSQVPLNRSAV
jgi:putative ABC transport system permease protein